MTVSGSMGGILSLAIKAILCKTAAALMIEQLFLGQLSFLLTALENTFPQHFLFLFEILGKVSVTSEQE